MTTLRQYSQQGIISGFDLIIGSTIGHWIDSKFPFTAVDQESSDSSKMNQIFKDVALTLVQCSATLILGMSLRNEILGDNYLANDISNGGIMLISMFRQDNFWRRVDNIYVTLMGYDTANPQSPTQKTPSDAVPVIETHHPVSQAFGNDL